MSAGGGCRPVLVLHPVAGEVSLDLWKPASFSFCCPVLKSAGDSMPLCVCLRLGR